MSLLEFIFYEKTNHIGLEFTLMISFYLCKEPFSNKFTFILGVTASAYGVRKEHHDPDVFKIVFKSHGGHKYTFYFPLFDPDFSIMKLAQKIYSWWIIIFNFMRKTIFLM